MERDGCEQGPVGQRHHAVRLHRVGRHDAARPRQRGHRAIGIDVEDLDGLALAVAHDVERRVAVFPGADVQPMRDEMIRVGRPGARAVGRHVLQRARGAGGVGGLPGLLPRVDEVERDTAAEAARDDPLCAGHEDQVFGAREAADVVIVALALAAFFGHTAGRESEQQRGNDQYECPGEQAAFYRVHPGLLSLPAQSTRVPAST